MRVIMNEVAIPGDEPEDDPIGQHLLAMRVDGKANSRVMRRLSLMVAGRYGRPIIDAGKKQHAARVEKAEEN